MGGGGSGRGGVGLRGQGRCEQRSEVFVKIKKKIEGDQVGVLGGGGGRGQDGCERRNEGFVKIQIKIGGGGQVGGGGGSRVWGGGVTLDVNEELKFL